MPHYRPPNRMHLFRRLARTQSRAGHSRLVIRLPMVRDRESHASILDVDLVIGLVREVAIRTPTFDLSGPALFTIRNHFRNDRPQLDAAGVHRAGQLEKTAWRRLVAQLLASTLLHGVRPCLDANLRMTGQVNARADEPRKRGMRQRGVTPLMYQYGETVITQTKEVARAVRRSTLTLGQKNRSPNGP